LEKLFYKKRMPKHGFIACFPEQPDDKVFRYFISAIIPGHRDRYYNGVQSQAGWLWCHAGSL